MSGNLDLWDAAFAVDPAHTKQFTKSGGFTGKAIRPYYLIRKATEQWGPMGYLWRVEIEDQGIVPGAPLLGPAGEVVGNHLVHYVQIRLYYPIMKDGDRTTQGVVPSFGVTEFAGRRKNGEFFTDDEAHKKSLTDALTKALSWLGFGGEVHMGLFDDSKYVEQRRKEEAEAAAAPPVPPAASPVAPGSMTDYESGKAVIDEFMAREGVDGFVKAWKTLSRKQRKACEAYKNQLKEQHGIK